MEIRRIKFFTIVIIMAFLLPLVQASRFSFQSETLFTEHRTSQIGSRDSAETHTPSSHGVEAESARQVPTGPDPLHHNYMPTNP